jgi:hypothetical protein
MSALIATPGGVICSDETATKGNVTAIKNFLEVIGPEWVAVQNFRLVALSKGSTGPRFLVRIFWLGHVEPSQATENLSIRVWTGHPLSNGPTQASPPMRHPIQTDTFDPGDPALVQRTETAQRCHEGFHIGASAYLVDGDRWVLLHSPYPYPCHYQFETKFQRVLTYPLPAICGEDPHLAMNAFEAHWNAERRRLWALEPMPDPPAPPPSAPPAPTPLPVQPRKSARDLHIVAVAGAVPLPGLEPWTEFRRRG